MKKTALKLLFAYVLFDLLVGGLNGGFLQLTPAAAAQTALTQTTLSSAVSGASVYSGNGATSIDTSVTLASVTNVVAPSFNSNSFGNLYTSSQGGQFASVLYVDHELMGVLGVNTSTKVVQVVRGIEGTLASDHVSGKMVLVGPPGAFQKYDPAGSCTTAATLFTPWVNVLNGNQWICSSLTLTWAPGWGNPLSNPASWVQTATVASAAGAITPSGPWFDISGTSAITGFNIPVGFDVVTGGCFTAKPTGIWTWTAAGNIATAGTTTAATTPVTFCWDTAAAKWIPSRLS